MDISLTRPDLKYNATKSAVMIYRSMTLKGCRPYCSQLELHRIILHSVASYKNIGYFITDDLSDDDDINRQRRTLFVQGNIILRKSNRCSLGVKLTLFFVLIVHLCLQHNPGGITKKSTITKLQIAYHNIYFYVYYPNMNEPATYAHF